MISDRDKLKKRAIITNDANLWVSFKKMRKLQIELRRPNQDTITHKLRKM